MPISDSMRKMYARKMILEAPKSEQPRLLAAGEVRIEGGGDRKLVLSNI